MGVSKLQITWKRSPASYDEDAIVTTLHFQDQAGNKLGSTPMAAVESAFSTFWNSQKTVVWQEIDLAEYRWYDQQLWPTKSPLERVTDITDVPGGAATTPLPSQIATSVTLVTDQRKRWGRCYLPGPVAAQLNTTVPLYLVSYVDATAAAFKDFLNACKAAFAIPVVWSPKGSLGPPAAAPGSVLPVKSVRCDQVPDVIRSRRWESSYYKTQLALS